VTTQILKMLIVFGFHSPLWIPLWGDLCWWLCVGWGSLVQIMWTGNWYSCQGGVCVLTGVGCVVWDAIFGGLVAVSVFVCWTLSCRGFSVRKSVYTFWLCWFYFDSVYLHIVGLEDSDVEEDVDVCFSCHKLCLSWFCLFFRFMPILSRFGPWLSLMD
jgi:hypothetical protein